jgi:hypothetical protein
MSVFDHIQSVLEGQESQPPIHLWHPELSGDIDITIRANGDWYHEGGLIKRLQLVKLFASILRRESDGDYYLVTPVEKWRLKVEDAPLVIVDMDVENQGTPQQTIIFTNNVERLYPAGDKYPLVVKHAGLGGQAVPYLPLENGLLATLNRPVFYRLVDIAETDGKQLQVLSNKVYFELGNIE